MHVLARIGVYLPLLGCSAIVDLDKFHEAPTASFEGVSGGASGEYQNLSFTLLALKPHVNQYFEYRVVDPSGFIQSRGIVNALSGEDVTFHARLSVPRSGGPYHLDYFADVNQSGGFDGLGSVITDDHAWRIDPLADYPEGSVAPRAGWVQVQFGHNTTFTNIDEYPSGKQNVARDTGLGARVRLQNLEPLMGKAVEVRIADKATHHLICLYRIPRPDKAAMDVTLPGSVESGGDYELDIYADANGNGAYDNPAEGAGDWGLRQVVTAADTGVDVTVDMAAAGATANVDVGEP